MRGEQVLTVVDLKSLFINQMILALLHKQAMLSYVSGYSAILA